MCAMIPMMVVMAAMAMKAKMDQQKAAKVQRQNAEAQMKIDQEALLRKRAESGDASAMEAFEKARANRVNEARIRVASGEQGSTTGNFQMDNMLQGLGFGTGLQHTADQRTSVAQKANMDLQLRGSGISFQNKMRTINASDPSGMDVMLAGGMAAANTYASTPGAFDPGTPSTGGTGNRMVNTRGGP